MHTIRPKHRKNLMTEWKEIPDLPNYEASSDGRIRFKGGIRQFGINKRYAPPCERKLQSHSGGYLQLRINEKNFFVHRLIAATFIANPDCLLEVNHRDGNRQNNRVENLEWCDRSGNLLHASRVMGKMKHCRMGRRLSVSEKSAVAVAEGSAKDIAKSFGVSAARVYRLRKALGPYRQKKLA